MEKPVFDLDAFLERIHYRDSTLAGASALRNLHIAYTLNVPFENLDVYYGRPIPLDGASLYRKIVTDRRGGYCFEMNGLFSLALEALGFKVANLLARVALNGGQYTTKTHQAMLVEADGNKWLADVGFGNDGIIAPLLLEENREQTQFAHTYRLVTHAALGYVLEKKNGDGYSPLYAFSLDPCGPEDFVMSNHFTATFPGSFFRTMRMCTMPTKEGRITLTDSHFKVVQGSAARETPIAGEGEFHVLLKEHFGLDLERIRPAG